MFYSNELVSCWPTADFGWGLWWWFEESLLPGSSMNNPLLHLLILPVCQTAMTSTQRFSCNQLPNSSTTSVLTAATCSFWWYLEISLWIIRVECFPPFPAECARTHTHRFLVLKQIFIHPRAGSQCAVPAEVHFAPGWRGARGKSLRGSNYNAQELSADNGHAFEHWDLAQNSFFIFNLTLTIVLGYCGSVKQTIFVKKKY